MAYNVELPTLSMANPNAYPAANKAAQASWNANWSFLVGGAQLTVDGVYGGATTYAMACLQNYLWPLEPPHDGVCGPRTWCALDGGLAPA